jgi:hypothetical protein
LISNFWTFVPGFHVAGADQGTGYVGADVLVDGALEHGKAYGPVDLIVVDNIVPTRDQLLARWAWPA